MPEQDLKPDLRAMVSELQDRAESLDKLPMFAQASAAREMLVHTLVCLSIVADRLDALTPYLDEVSEGAA